MIHMNEWMNEWTLLSGDTHTYIMHPTQASLPPVGTSQSVSELLWLNNQLIKFMISFTAHGT